MSVDKAIARQHWRDAERLDDAVLDRLLTAAELAITPTATIATDGTDPRWALAVTLQARETHTAYDRVGDVIGAEGVTIRVPPLTARVLELVRPRPVVPVVG